VAAQHLKLNIWLQRLCVCIAGALLPLAFAPWDLYPIAVFSVAVLFYVWHKSSPIQAFLFGLVFGIGYFGCGISWIHVSIHEHGAAPLPLAWFLTSLFVVYLSLFIALQGYLVTRFFKPSTVKLLLVFPASWVLTEVVRGWFMTGFPWLYLGHSQTESWLAGFFPVAGSLFVSFIVALLSASLVAIMVLRFYQLLAVPLLLPLLGLGFDKVSFTEKSGDELTATLVQGNVAQKDKWKASSRQKILTNYVKQSQPFWDNDIILWPENAIPIFSHRMSEFLQNLHQQAEKTDTELVIGLPYLDQDTKQYYNSMMHLTSQNIEENPVYLKHHLVPFGEYVPLSDLLRGVIAFFDLPMSNFSRGDRIQIPFILKGQQAKVAICYEIAYPEYILDTMPDTNFIITVSNDSWFGDSIGPFQHLQIARVRALEFARPVLRATNNGLTVFIDHKGRINAQAEQFKQTVLSATFQPMSGRTPFMLFGDTGIILMMLLIMVLSRPSRY
jgi:apolipoprotein N-acyltransferase